MAKLHGLQADYVFRGVEHVVRMTVEGNLLEVEVEDRLTTDQWRGEFDAAFIEDLTHKTGNFKQFGIFCSMLESALKQIRLDFSLTLAEAKALPCGALHFRGFLFELGCRWYEAESGTHRSCAQSSESVTLDLLTYNDLESLRSRKIGVGPRLTSATKASPLSSKRYLIVIYSVEFDRIHYPLPLPYVGKPDPVVLQKVIRELKEELALLKGKTGKDFRDIEIRRLQAELQQALEDKQAAETALVALQEELKLTSKSSALKEVKILKKVVQSLEEELTKERAKHQRVASKRLQENRQLTEELAELRATERGLRIRVRSLTSELALYRKGRFTPLAPSPQNHLAQSSLSRAGTSAKRREDCRSPSGERSNSRERSGAWAPSRQQSTSRERRSGSQGRLKRQSPSPTGSRGPRFDPTAFVKAKERKQKEAEQNNKRCVRRGMGDAPPSGWHRTQPRGPSAFGASGKSRGRSSSVESFRSRRSSASSGSEMDEYSEPATPRGQKRVGRSRKPLGTFSWNRPSRVPRADSGHRKPLVSTPTSGKQAGKENLYDEPSADLSEIDARLQALQEYMNKLETRT